MYPWFSNTNAGTFYSRQIDLHDMFNFSLRFQVLVRNQEEYDLFRGYELMYGRTLELDIWPDYISKDCVTFLPFVVTTWKPNEEQFRVISK